MACFAYNGKPSNNFDREKEKPWPDSPVRGTAVSSLSTRHAAVDLDLDWDWDWQGDRMPASEPGQQQPPP